MAKKKKTSVPNPVGRPPLFKSPREMEVKIKEYFDKCPDNRSTFFEGKEIKVPCPTISGLALFLGFEDRHSMFAYEKKPEFSATIKRARANIVRTYEQLTHTGTCSGAIFMLKNYGYTDKTEVEHTGDLILGYGHRKAK